MFEEYSINTQPHWIVQKIKEYFQGILQTSEGNVIHDHILDEARRRAVEEGLAETEGAVTKEILCQMLKKMKAELKQQPRRNRDTAKIKKIEATMKGLGCKRSRHS